MVDAHCHLNFHAFENDYKETLKRALDAGVKTIINVGTSIESSQKAVELSEQFENLYAIVGIHPHHADKLEKGWEKQIEKLAKNKKVIAIGEIGIDYYSYKSNGIVDAELQKEVFEKQIKIAFKNKLPLQIHSRHASKDIMEVLKANKNLLMDPPGMFHCFAGNFDYLNFALGMGFFIGFDGNVTYKGLAPGEDTLLGDLAKNTPLDRLIVETDAPYLAPEPHRGSRNEPSYVIITADFIAKIKNVSLENLDKATTENIKHIFKI